MSLNLKRKSIKPRSSPHKHSWIFRQFYQNGEHLKSSMTNFTKNYTSNEFKFDTQIY